MSARDDFMSSIEVHVTTNIFRIIEGRVGQWIFHIFTEDPNDMGDFNFKGNQASKILENY